MTLKSYERRNYDGEEKERRMRKKGKRMAKRTNRPFPPEGAKEPFKIFNGVSWRPSKQRGGDLKEESSSSFPTRREKHGAIREKGNLKAPYHLDSFFSCERATLRQEQCDADQTVEPCNSRSNVEIERSKPRCFSYSSSYASGCAIAEDAKIVD